MTEPVKPGWQDPPVQRPAVQKCPHIGLLFAVFTVHAHKEGHKWVCNCGKVFIVVSDAGRNKHLEPYR